MKYEKPGIVLVASATDAVQARKGSGSPDSICNGGTGLTVCTYQSDE